jgi:hypothetical protein
MADVMKLLKSERDSLRKRLRGLESAIGALAGDAQKDLKRTVKKAKKMSAAARKKISAAQKKRWAALKKKAG